jgi:IS30 family transposase
MNQLDVSLQHSIVTLAAKGWSARKIARELGIHRETVSRYLQAVEDSKPAIPPTGSQKDCDSKPAIVPAGSKLGRTSQCAPLSEVIKQGLLAGLSAQRIYQDLVTDHAFFGG